MEMQSYMKFRDIQITPHALIRFKERLQKSYPNIKKNPESYLLELLGRTQRYKMSINRFLNRANKHGATEFLCTQDGWRFVLTVDDEGNRILTTVERIARYQN